MRSAMQPRDRPIPLPPLTGSSGLPSAKERDGGPDKGPNKQQHGSDPLPPISPPGENERPGQPRPPGRPLDSSTSSISSTSSTSSTSSAPSISSALSTLFTSSPSTTSEITSTSETSSTLEVSPPSTAAVTSTLLSTTITTPTPSLDTAAVDSSTTLSTMITSLATSSTFISPTTFAIAASTSGGADSILTTTDNGLDPTSQVPSDVLAQATDLPQTVAATQEGTTNQSNPNNNSLAALIAIFSSLGGLLIIAFIVYDYMKRRNRREMAPEGIQSSSKGPLRERRFFTSTRPEFDTAGYNRNSGGFDPEPSLGRKQRASWLPEMIPRRFRTSVGTFIIEPTPAERNNTFYSPRKLPPTLQKVKIARSPFFSSSSTVSILSPFHLESSVNQAEFSKNSLQTKQRDSRQSILNDPVALSYDSETAPKNEGGYSNDPRTHAKPPFVTPGTTTEQRESISPLPPLPPGIMSQPRNLESNQGQTLDNKQFSFDLSKILPTSKNNGEDANVANFSKPKPQETVSDSVVLTLSHPGGERNLVNGRESTASQPGFLDVDSWVSDQERRRLFPRDSRKLPKYRKGQA